MPFVPKLELSPSLVIRVKGGMHSAKMVKKIQQKMVWRKRKLTQMHKVKVTSKCIPKLHEELMMSIKIAGKGEEKEKPSAYGKEMVELFDLQ